MSNFLSDLWGSFTGSSAKKATDAAHAEATGYLNQGQTSALGGENQGYDAAQGYYSPYAAAGGRAATMYQNALGINGAGAQHQFMQSYQGADPFRQWNEDNTSRMLARRAQASGWGGGSGPAQLAIARAGLERGSADYQNYLGQLAGQAGMGAQVAGQQGQLAAQHGNQLANIYGGFAQQQAGNAINYGNAQAANSNIFANNLLGAGSVAAKAFSGGGKMPAMPPVV